MTNTMPMDVLETRAAAERRQLHDHVAELKSSLRETLDSKKLARQYLLEGAGISALAGLILGYSLTGIFTRD